MHNFNILLLRGMARAGLLSIDTVDHSSVLNRLNLLEAKAAAAQREGDRPTEDADFLTTVQQTKCDTYAAPPTPQHNISYTDIYGDVTPNKCGNNEMNVQVHVTESGSF